MMRSWLERYFRSHIIKVGGVEIPLRSAINFVGATFEDNPDDDTVDIVSGGGAAAEEGVCTLEQFGATGTEETDTEAWTEMLAAAQAGTYRKLKLAAREYFIGEDAVFNGAAGGAAITDFEIEGHGPATVLNYTSTTVGISALIWAKNLFGFSLRNFVVRGDDELTQRAILMGSGTTDAPRHVLIDGVWVFGTTKGIHLTNSPNPTEEIPQVSNCRAHDCTGEGFIVGCEALLTDNIATRNGIGFEVTGGNVMGSGNKANNNATGIVVRAGSNDGHGAMVGFTANHNTSWNIDIEDLNNGFTFNGMYAYAGGIRSLSSTLVQFVYLLHRPRSFARDELDALSRA